MPGAVSRALTCATRWVFSPSRLSRDDAVRRCEQMAALTTVTASLEYLAGGSDLPRGRLNEPSINLAHAGRRWRPMLRVAASPVGTRVMHGARVAAGLALLLPSGRRTRLAADAVLAGTSLVVLRTESHGTDGSDQVALLTHVTTAVARAGRAPTVTDAALWFLALQSALSYAASGAAKLISRTWMNGDALPGVFRTYSYGHAPTWRLLTRNPTFTRWLSRGVVVFECALPFALLWRHRLARPYVAASAGFHLLNGFTMGLGRFTMAFAGMHPAVLYVSRPRATTGRDPDSRGDDARPAVPRSDALPVLAGAAIAGTWLVSATAALADRRRVQAGRPTDRFFTATSGNVLCFHTSAATDPDAPLLVFEAGLGESDLYWCRIEQLLAGRYPLLSYARPGYGRSRWRAGRDHSSLDVARADVAELITEVAGTRPVLLIGHSLGGYLALTATPALTARLSGVVALDPSHPGRHDQLESQVRVQERTVAVVRASVYAGLGPLMRLPAELAACPRQFAALMRAQYRDAPAWSAMHREVVAAIAEWAAPDRGAAARMSVAGPGRHATPGHQREPRPPRVLVLTAEHSAARDPEQLELDRALTARVPAHRHVVIPGADHVGMLLRAEHAATVADHIAAFAEASR